MLGAHSCVAELNARWVDDDGEERAESFASERAAKTHLRQVARGEYANTTGKLTFKQYFEQWALTRCGERAPSERSTRRLTR